jgi:hypothetical protein
VGALQTFAIKASTGALSCKSKIKGFQRRVINGRPLILAKRNNSQVVSSDGQNEEQNKWVSKKNHGTVWMVGVNICPKENCLPLPFAPTNICPLGCMDGGVNVDVDERGRAGPTTNLLQFATF